MAHATERAADLLAEHALKIGRAVYRVGKKLDPTVGAVSPAAAEASGASIIRAVETVLRTGDEAPFLATVQSVIELRRLTGYSLPQFIAMSHAYLPVVRRVFLQHEPDTALALRAYDAVEARMLPLIVRMLDDIYLHAAPPGDFSEDEVTARMSRSPSMSANPFVPISVEEEITAEE